MRLLMIFTSILFILQFAQSQCVSGDCISGRGKFNFSDKSIYTGPFSHGKMHGQGILVSSNGATYTGSFKSGYKHGTGKLSMKSGASYIGQFVKNQFQGKGKYQYLNGDIYKGEWVNGKKEGHGTYLFINGDQYIGQFHEDAISGQGLLTCADGTRKTGVWKNGVCISQESTSNNIVYAGTMTYTDREDKLRNCNKMYCDGVEGRYDYRDGSYYEGQFLQGSPEGEGVCHYSNGSLYTGGWKNHGPHGIGVMTFTSGMTYNAEWNMGTPIRKIEKPYKPKKYAQAKTQKPKNDFDPEVKIYACIVGIASYTHMPSLKYTDDDAYQVYAFLKSPAGGAIPDERISILIDDAATRSNIVSELTKMANNADENDVVLIYLSGHGLQGSYIPSDFDGFNNNLPYTELLTIIDQSDAKHKLCIADACHSGSMYAAKGISFQGLESFYNQFDQLKGGTAFLTSSKSEEVSLEYSGLRQGIFSHFLINGLKGAADANNNQIISLGELYQYIHKNVQSYTAQAQSPTLSGNFNEEMPVGIVSFH